MQNLEVITLSRMESCKMLFAVTKSNKQKHHIETKQQQFLLVFRIFLCVVCDYVCFAISCMYTCSNNISEATSYELQPSGTHINSMLFFLMLLFVCTLNTFLMIKICNQHMNVSACDTVYYLHHQIHHGNCPVQKIRNVLESKFQR